MSSPLRIDEKASQAFEAAMRREAGSAAAGKVVPLPRTPDPAPSSHMVEIGRDERGGATRLDLVKLIDGRLLVQGASGAGKTWTLRRLLEQTAGTIQQIVVDPEGEFQSIAEQYGHLVVDAAQLDTAALATAAVRAREHRLSLVLDLSDLDRERQMLGAAAFVAALVEAPREYWHPCLVVVDEAHLFAPWGGQSGAAPAVRKASIDALTDLMSRGRKRGLCGVIATQRLARLAKSVISDVHNFLIGLNSLDLDIRRAAETIGWDTRRAFDRLPMLAPGDFVASGPCFTPSPVVTHVGSVRTRHRGATPSLGGTRLPPMAEAARMLDLDGLLQASAEDLALREGATMTGGLRAVRAFVREPSFAMAGRVWELLKPLVPEGAQLAELAAYLEAEREAVVDALQLLDRYGLLEFSGAGDERAVRLVKGALL